MPAPRTEPRSAQHTAWTLLVVSDADQEDTLAVQEQWVRETAT